MDWREGTDQRLAMPTSAAFDRSRTWHFPPAAGSTGIAGPGADGCDGPGQPAPLSHLFPAPASPTVLALCRAAR
jgi:hypothetical protein